jgi:hypothetical protein
VAASLLACGLPAGAAQWQPVPGAPDLAIDVASLQQERTQVAAWIRWWGRPSFLPALAARTQAARVHRTLLRTVFDCSRHTLRVVAANAYDGQGVPVFMSSVPEPEQAVRDAELTWAYDAACEAARSAGRL